MKIALFHPQINNYGGGEYVCLVIAECLSALHDVTVLVSSLPDVNRLQKFFSVDLAKVKFAVRPFANFVQKIPGIPSYRNSLQLKYLKDLDKFDIVIDTGTNGWFTQKLRARTICYIHFPHFVKKHNWKQITEPLLVNPKKAFKYDVLLCNSEFTKKHLANFTDKDVSVVYPPVETAKIKPGKKSNIIVSVGRFTPEKKHDVMIRVFIDGNFKGWELHLIGSYQEGVGIYDSRYIEKLKSLAKGANVHLHMNMDHNDVLHFLERAKIYWHARGFGETDPNDFESFGITTVEAMAAGCMPIVINLGAQPEIVKHGESGYCWNSLQELISLTKKAMGGKNQTMIKSAIKQSKIYDLSIFREKIIKIVEGLG